jgi:transcription elongation GreA/GreB family factor
LSNVEIIKDEKSKKDDVVDYGSKVLIKIEWDKNEYTIKIVWTWEVGISWKDDLLVSLDSPIWAAIKWHKAWDDVKMRLGNDRKTIKVLKIS